MSFDYLSEFALNNYIALALAEDVGDGDHTSLACIPQQTNVRGTVLMKDDGIIAGISIAERIFLKVDPQLNVKSNVRDGQEVSKGDIVMELQGEAKSILKAERLMLNTMQRMSGIATYTKNLSSLISHTNARLLDTRKTTPNFRLLEKWAVLIGGGTNHRYGLFDMILIKDNHIDFAGGIPQALTATQKYLTEKQLDLKVEIETRNLTEVQQVLEHGGADRIMLDNMSCEDMVRAVEIIGDAAETEASGGIDETTITAVAETGVDFISVGALTHSVKSLDISLNAS